MPADTILIPAIAVERLRRKAKSVKKKLGVSHHEALDIVARDTKRFRDWHHVITEAKATALSEQAFNSGFVVGLDAKDADFYREGLKYFVPDERLMFFVVGEFEEQNPQPFDDDLSFLWEELNELVYFRSKKIIPENESAARALCNEEFFFTPIYGRLNGYELPFFLDPVEEDEGDGHV